MKASKSWHLLLPLALLAASIIGLTAATVSRTVAIERGKELVRLEAIADLKAQQLTDWLAERQDEARFLRDSPYWAYIYRRWRQGGDTASRDQLFHRLEEFRSQDGFRDVLLLDAGGHPLWSTASRHPAVDPPLQDFVRHLGRHSKLSHFGPYRDAGGAVRLDFVARMQPAGSRPGPIVVLRADPSDYLSAAFQAWPVPDTSGEILLFRRDRDEVLYINQLRYQADTAIKLKMPITAAKLLAAQILRGDAPQEGLVEGGITETFR